MSRAGAHLGDLVAWPVVEAGSARQSRRPDSNREPPDYKADDLQALNCNWRQMLARTLSSLAPMAA